MQILKGGLLFSGTSKDEFQESTWLLFLATDLRMSVSCFGLFEKFKVLQ